MTAKLALGFALCCLGHIFAWFQLNSQFAWEWWRDRPIFTVCLYAVPTGLSFLYGAKLIVGEVEEVWSARLLAFAASYLIFPFLTWWILNESPFTTKTMICIFLSFMIIAVQLFWNYPR